MMESNYEKLIKKFEEEFPKMIKKEQGIYVGQLVKFFPSLIKELEDRWEMDFKYDEAGENIIFIFPILKK